MLVFASRALLTLSKCSKPVILFSIYLPLYNFHKMHMPKFVKSLLCRGRPVDNTETYITDRKNEVNVQAKSISSSLTGSSTDLPAKQQKLVVMGMGCSWPAHTIEPKDLEEYAAKVYDLEQAPG